VAFAQFFPGADRRKVYSQALIGHPARRINKVLLGIGAATGIKLHFAQGANDGVKPTDRLA